MAQGVGVLLLLFLVHTASAQVDFRLYVSSPDENKIYAFDDVGATMDTFDTYGPAIGVAFDHFTSDYTITPTAPSFVYSVNYSGYAEFYRQYISSATPEYMYTSPVTDATIKRIKIDPTSGNMFYLAVVAGSPTSSFIAVLTPSLEHVNLISGLFDPADIAMHAGQGLLFWSVEYDSAIYFAYMDGSGSTNTPLVSGVAASALAVDSQANMLYWIDTSSTSIESCDFDGNRGSTLLYLPDMMVADIMIDGRNLFYTNSTSSEIVKVDLDGSQISYLVSYIPGVTQLGAMTAYSTDSTALPKNVYCDFRDGRGDCSDICLPNVMGRSCRCPDDVPLELNDRTCTNAELCNATVPHVSLSTLCNRHKFEVCDFTCNYPYTSPIGHLRCEGTYWNITDPCKDASATGSTTSYPDSYSTSAGGSSPIDFRLYVTSPDENKIYEFDDVGATMKTFDTYGPAIGLDFDHFNSAYLVTPTAPSFVYSIDYMGTAEFYRQYLSSPTPEYIYTCPVTNATIKRIKIDPTSGNMFYLGVVTDSSSSSFISVLTPSLEHINIISGIFDAADIAIHAEHGLVFWSVVYESAIYSAYMDGSGGTNIPMISGVSAKALAMDTQANMLYWADSSSTTIETCDFYGNRGPTLTMLPDMMIADIMIDGRALLYTNTTSSEIVKIDLDGSHVSTLVSYIPGVNQLGAMTAYSSDSAAVPKNMYCYSRDGRGDCSDICLPNAMGRSCRCRDDVALELNDRTCTNAELCNSTISHASLSTLCDRHKLEVCDFSCNYPYTSPIGHLRCEGTYWDVTDPCTDTTALSSTTPYPDPSGPGSGDFRLYVTNSNRSKIYSIDQYGTAMETETVYVFETLSGIAVDRFTSENSTSRQSIVYSTIAYNSATFYRQYLYGETYYEYLFNEYDAISERFAIDPTSGNIYYILKDAYSQQSNISVFTPSGDRISIVSGLYEPKDIVLQPEQGRMFWTDIMSDGGTAVISTADMDGSNVRHIITENIVFPNGLAISYYENMLYWTDSDLNQIEKCDFDGQQRSTVMTLPGTRLGDILIDGNYFYFTNLDNSDITRVDLYSYTSEIFATIYDDHGLGLEALAVYTTDLLRINGQCERRNGLGDCSDLCLPNTMGHTCACFYGGNLDRNGQTCDNTILCSPSFSSGSLSESCSLHKYEDCQVTCEGSGQIVPIQCDATGAWNNTNPCSDSNTAFDFRLYVNSPDENRIYAFDDVGAIMEIFDTYGAAKGLAFDHFISEFSITPTSPSFVYSIDDMGGAEFNRQYLTDSASSYMYISSVFGATVERLVIDPTSGNIFYIGIISGSSSFIAVMTPSLEHINLISGLTQPKALAMHAGQGLLFWSDTSDQFISSAYMDGSGRTDIISGVFTNVLAVDSQANMLYWTDSSSTSIESCDFYGNRGPTLIFLSNMMVEDIMIDGGALFYTNSTSSEIVMVDLDGSQTSTMFSYIPGVNRLGAMTAYSSDSTAVPKNMYCNSRDGRGDCSNICLPSAMARSCKCPDDVALEYNDRTCTNAELCDANIPHAFLSTLCDRHKFEICDFNCDYPYMSSISQLRCEGTYWNVTNPCTETTTATAGFTTSYSSPYSPSTGVENPDFRFIVTNPHERQIYVFNQAGDIMNTYDIFDTIRGIAMDNFRSQYYSGPTRQSFVYSVDYTGSGGADFFRQYLDEMTPQYLFSSPVSGAVVERLVIDSSSGNIYYIGTVPGSQGFIGVITPNNDHVTLIQGLSEPKAIALYTVESRIFWSDIGQSVIRSAFMDGSDQVDSVLNVKSYGIAVDYQESKLYYTDVNSQAIMSYDLQTTGVSRVKSFYHLALNDILVDGDFLYYTNLNYSEVAKINKAVIEDETTFASVPATTSLNAMAVFSWDSAVQHGSSSCYDRDGLGDCSNVCLPTASSHVCACHDGVSLKGNGITCENAQLCPQTISEGSFLSGCNWQILEVCGVRCDDGILTAHIQCEGTHWNNMYPCSETTTATAGFTTSHPTPYSPSTGVENPDFRFIVTNPHERQIYVFNQAGDIMNTYDIFDTIRGIAMDNFRSQYYSGPTRQSFVYSVDYTGSGGADFFRQYLDEMTPQYLFSSPVSGAVVERLVIDSLSGNIYYIGTVPSSQGFIGVITPNNDHVTLIQGLSEPKAIALYTADSRIFWSDIGQSVIRSVFMDGSNQVDTVFNVKSYGIAVDYQESKLYYTDVNSQAIMSYDLQTAGVSTVKSFYHLTLNDILVDGDFLYYTNLNYSEVAKINKAVIEDETTFAYVPATTSLNAMAVFSWDSAVQHGSSSCYDRDGLGDCSNVCLPTASSHVCACHDGVSLKANGITCENAQLCPQSISQGSFLSGCNWHILEVCGVRCDDGILTAHIQCEGTHWNDMYPCSDQTTQDSITNHLGSTYPTYGYSGSSYPTHPTYSFSGSSYPTYPTNSYSGPSFPTYPTNSYAGLSVPTYPTYSYSGSSFPTYPTNSYTGLSFPTYRTYSYSDSSFPTYPTYSYSDSSFPTYPTNSYSGSSFPKYPTYSYSDSSFPTYPTNSYSDSSFPTYPTHSYSDSSFPTYPTHSYSGSSFPTYPTNSYSGSSFPTYPTYSYSDSSFPTYPTNSYSGSSFPTYPTYSYSDSSFPTYPTNSYSDSSFPTYPTHSYSDSSFPTYPSHSYTGSSFPTYPTNSYSDSSFPTYPTNSYSDSSFPTYPTNSYSGSSFPTYPTHSYSGSSFPTYPTNSYSGSSFPTYPTYSYSDSSFPTYPTNSYSDSSFPTYPTNSYSDSSFPTYPTNSYSDSSFPTYPTHSYSGSSFPTYPTNSYSGSSFPTYPTYSYSDSSFPTYPTNSYSDSSFPTYPTNSYSDSSFPTYPTHSHSGSSFPTYPTHSYSGSSFPTYPTNSYSGSSFPTYPTNSYSGSSFPTYPTNSYSGSSFPTYPTHSFSGSSFPTYPTNSYSDSSFSTYPTYSYSDSSFPTYPTNSYSGSSFPTYPTHSYSGSSFPTYPTHSYSGSSFPTYPTHSYTGSSFPTYPTHSYSGSSFPTYPTHSYSGSSFPTYPTHSYSGSSFPTYPTNSYSGSSFPTYPTNSYSGSSFPTYPTNSYSGSSFPTYPTNSYSGSVSTYPTDQTFPPSSGSGSTYPTSQTFSPSDGSGSTYSTGQTFPLPSSSGSTFPTGQTVRVSGSTYPTGQTFPPSSGSGPTYSTGQTFPSSGGTGSAYISGQTFPPSSGSGASNPTGQTLSTSSGSGTIPSTQTSASSGSVSTTASAATAANPPSGTAGASTLATGVSASTTVATGGNTSGTTGDVVTRGNTASTTGKAITGGSTAGTTANPATEGNSAGTTPNTVTGGNTGGTTGNSVTGGNGAGTTASAAPTVGATTTVQTTTAGAMSTLHKYLTVMDMFVSVIVVAVINTL